MKKIEIKEINVEASTGALLNDCIKEGIQLSFEKETTVNLFHNNSKFKINSKEIMKSIPRAPSGRM